MRVISQNGLIDVPYEMTAFHIVGEDVRMNMVGDTGKGTVMASYSTRENARKAMEALHERYESLRKEEVYEDGVYYYVPIFQFPTDDEVNA